LDWLPPEPGEEPHWVIIQNSNDSETKREFLPEIIFLELIDKKI
jgi:hypothetical protein